MKFELKEYSLWGTIGKGISMYFTNLPFLFLVGIIANIPIILYMYYKPALIETSYITVKNFYLPFAFLTLLTEGIASGIIIHVLMKKYLNTDPSSPYYTGTLQSMILPLFGLAPIISLGLVAIPAAGIIAKTGEGLDGFIIYFIIPSLYFFVIVCLSFNTLVIERQGIFKSLLRSKNLTQNRKWKAFWYLVCTFLTCLGFWAILDIISHIILSKGGTENSSLTREFFAVIAYSILSPIPICVSIVFYFNMRIEKEGFNIEYLADQFSLAGASPQREKMPEE